MEQVWEFREGDSGVCVPPTIAEYYPQRSILGGVVRGGALIIHPAGPSIVRLSQGETLASAGICESSGPPYTHSVPETEPLRSAVTSNRGRFLILPSGGRTWPTWVTSSPLHPTHGPGRFPKTRSPSPSSPDFSPPRQLGACFRDIFIPTPLSFSILLVLLAKGSPASFGREIFASLIAFGSGSIVPGH